jgi:hypothetical protein
MAFEYDRVRTELRIGTDAYVGTGMCCCPPAEWVSR